jgi:arylsulfatase A-like enzyme
MMGSHHLLAKTVMYEESVKVPWLMRIPWLNKSQHLLKGRYSHIDLIPTLLNAVHRLELADILPGKSLLPGVRGSSKFSDDVFIEWNPALRRGTPAYGLLSVPDEEAERVYFSHTRTVITQDGWKLCLSENDKNQLFNLNKDPLEKNNIFDVNENKEIIKNLSEKISQWQVKTGDSINLEESKT